MNCNTNNSLPVSQPNLVARKPLHQPLDLTVVDWIVSFGWNDDHRYKSTESLAWRQMLQTDVAERPEFVFCEHSGLQVRISRTKMTTDADKGRRVDAGDLEDKAAKVLGIRWQYRF